MHRANNRKETPGRKIQLQPRYSKKDIRNGQTSIERARRARCFKNIKTTD